MQERVATEVLMNQFYDQFSDCDYLELFREQVCRSWTWTADDTKVTKTELLAANVPVEKAEAFIEVLKALTKYYNVMQDITKEMIDETKQ